MSDTLLELVPDYGIPILMLATFLSCIAVPIPASLLMLAAGAFAAGGDIPLELTIAAALLGALVGDQAGYAIGVKASHRVDRIAASSPARGRLVSRARAFSDRWGAPGVFLSRWLMSPLGPYVNLLSGASNAPWLSFTVWSALGEVIWVGMYIGLGFAFSGYITDIAELMSNLVGFLAAGAVAFFLARLVFVRNNSAE